MIRDQNQAPPPPADSSATTVPPPVTSIPDNMATSNAGDAVVNYKTKGKAGIEPMGRDPNAAGDIGKPMPRG